MQFFLLLSGTCFCEASLVSSRSSLGILLWDIWELGFAGCFVVVGFWWFCLVDFLKQLKFVLWTCSSWTVQRTCSKTYSRIISSASSCSVITMMSSSGADSLTCASSSAGKIKTVFGVGMRIQSNFAQVWLTVTVGLAAALTCLDINVSLFSARSTRWAPG